MNTVVSIRALEGSESPANPRALERDSGRNFGLDLLRAGAIILVLISHFSLVFIGLLDPTPVVQVTGFLGVELFFVLSGFLIGRILLSTVLVSPDLSTVKRFWTRRWLRTIPAYYTVITLLIVLSAADKVSPAFDWRFLSFYAFLQNFFPREVWEGFFGVGWSLIIEEWFYLLFPLIVVLARRFTLGREDTTILALCALMIFVPLALRFVLALNTSDDWWTIRKSIIPRFDAIGFGVFVAALHAYRPAVLDAARRRPWSCSIVSALGIAGLAVALLSGPRVVESLGMKTLGFTIAPACFALTLPALLTTHPANPAMRSTASFITFISATSYSVYLVHWDILQVVRSLPFGQPHYWSAFLRIPLGLAATFMVAWILHRAVERPFMRWRDIQFPRAG
jgi:peptidoglycan/LPS O-acetylase OafA/YrhL